MTSKCALVLVLLTLSNRPCSGTPAPTPPPSTAMAARDRSMKQAELLLNEGSEEAMAMAAGVLWVSSVSSIFAKRKFSALTRTYHPPSAGTCSRHKISGGAYQPPPSLLGKNLHECMPQETVQNVLGFKSVMGDIAVPGWIPRSLHTHSLPRKLCGVIVYRLLAAWWDCSVARSTPHWPSSRFLVTPPPHRGRLSDGGCRPRSGHRGV